MGFLLAMLHATLNSDLLSVHFIDGCGLTSSATKQLLGIPASSLQTMESFWEQLYLGLVIDVIEGWGETHTLLSTEKGYFGYVQGKFSSGDTLCVLDGCVSPLLLRSVESQQRYTHVGSCFVLGLQYGAAAKLVRSDGLEMQQFEIILKKI